eukprot:gnl/Spiro4/15486_TR8339_c0_g1_i1.p1 gnl/Spiro4/15486_TR8339_c0_g1~~gnl/Spiro4/15486_TR8339_c0_g1_i1.p1  ORF type:complete len:389 (-),score=47.39 gnl/Spiro4/15486_TR8339_c0_g1_i1:856-1992(-)
MAEPALLPKVPPELHSRTPCWVLPLFLCLGISFPIIAALLLFNHNDPSYVGTWTALILGGDSPAPRSLHSVAITSIGKMYVYGGDLGRTRALDPALYELDISAWFLFWRRVPMVGEAGLSTLPPARFGHASVAVGTNIFYLGGEGGSVNDPVLLQDFFVVSTVTGAWKSLGSTTPRTRHSMCAMGTVVYTFGGWTSGVLNNELAQFDSANLRAGWSVLPSNSATLPSPRSGAALAAIRKPASRDHHLLFVAGGSDGKAVLGDFFVYDTESRTWNSPETAGDVFVPRGGAPMVTLEETWLVVMCGQTEKEGTTEFSNDVFVFNVHTQTWGPAYIDSPTLPSPRANCGAAEFDGQIWLHGGSDGAMRLGDSWLLEISPRT